MRGAFGAALAVLVAAVTPAWSQQLPSGGTVTSGGVTIGAPSNGTLNIDQSTSHGIINWQGFSVGQGGTVNFNQPSSAAATLNRVVGSTPSSIAGTIRAPGTVLLVNPNGIAITKSGVINTGSFAASTLDIKDSDFLAGNYKFTGNGSSAGVTNAGRINVSDGGFAALLGGQVANTGVISARLGKVGLGAGELITLDLAGDGFLSVAVPSSQFGNLVDGNGALVTNSGKIRANGGQVFLSAATAHNILRDAVYVPGSIRANSVGTHNGRIVINGGAGGRVNVTGRLAANGGRTGNGGSVAVTGAAVNLNGKVTANGKTGGTITAHADQDLSVAGIVAAKGSDGQGGRIDLTGANVALLGALIDASASGQGATGGYITIIASDTATIDGTIKAGGGEGGHGGFIETSGKHLHVADTTRVSTLAKNGAAGTWFIDPNDFTIAAAGGDITGATLSANLAGGSVIILSSDGATAGNGDIFVNDAVSWSSGSSLTLDAFHSINVNASISVDGAGSLILKTNDGGSGGDYNIAAGQSISFTAGSGSGAGLTINGAVYTLLYSMSDVENINTALGGQYALATSLTSSTIYSDAVVANSGNIFNGTFAGLGHTISDLTISAAGDNIGLFGHSAGIIRDVGIFGATVSGNNVVGTLAGQNDGIVLNSFAADGCGCGAVVGASSVGGLVGSSAGIISGSYATVTVSGSGNGVGGLLGFAGAGSIDTSYATGTVFGDPVSANNVGGLIGTTNPFVTVSRSYATGSVEGNTAIGGLIGQNFANVTESYATGNVRGTNQVGGLVGWAGTFGGSGSLLRVYATGLVGGNPAATSTNIGGLIGQNDGSVTDAYATGAVAGDDFVGGLIGSNSSGATVTNVYATGWVTFVNGSTTNFGALAGANQGTITNAYWNTQTSGQTVAIGVDSGSSTTFAKTTAELQAALPAGFDPAIWGIVPSISYPYLNWRFPTGPTVVSGTANTGFSGLNDNRGLVVGIAIDGTVLTVTAATGADGSYLFMIDPMAADSAAFTYLTTDTFPNGSSEPSNAVGYLMASAPGFVQGHATGLDFAPDRVLTVASNTIVDMDGVIALMERALYGPTLSTSVPAQLFDLGLDPIDIVRFDSSTFFSELVFSPFGGANYRLQSAAANFNFNQPLGCGCDLINLEVIGSGNLAVNQPIVAGGSVLMMAPGDVTIGSGGFIEADGPGNAIVLAAGGSFINDAGFGALNLGNPNSRWLIYSNAPGTAADYGGLDSNNTAIWNATYATLSPGNVTALGNRYLFAFQPTLTFTSTSELTKAYGDDATAAVAGSSYTVSGLQAGVAGAFLGDDAASVYSGAPAFTSAGSGVSANAGLYSIAGGAGTLTSLANYAFAFVNNGKLTVSPQAVPSDPNNNSGNNPSQFNASPTPNGEPNDLTITFQNPTGGPVNVSFTPPANGSNVTPRALPGGAALATNNGSVYLPISQFDPNQYSQFKLPGFENQAGEAAIFTMIARGADPEHAVDYLIDTFWNGTSGAWNPPNAALAGKVTFSDGAGNTIAPTGNAGFPIVSGATDFSEMLKAGPVMISDGGQPAHWLLATQMTADGKGIVANDPATGKQVVLGYDASTKTVGGVTGVFDAKTKGFITLADAGGDLPAGSAGLSALQGFVPSSFIAVAVK